MYFRLRHPSNTGKDSEVWSTTMRLVAQFMVLVLLAFSASQTESFALVTESRKWLEMGAIESESGLCLGGVQTTIEKREDDPRSWRMNRICLCGGHALHGFVVEMEDGTRRACVTTGLCRVSVRVRGQLGCTSSRAQLPKQVVFN